MDDDDAAAFDEEFGVGRLLLKRGRLCERCLEPLKLDFLTKLMSVSLSSKRGVKEVVGVDVEDDCWLSMWLMDVADFSSGRP